MKKFISVSLSLFASLGLFAQTGINMNPPGAKPAILRSIENTNASSETKINIYQDSRIEKALSTYLNRAELITSGYDGPGYRVQVFSSNAHKTALNEAVEIERQLRNAFPQQAVYRTFSSPFWKVRIGNFKTIGEARNLRAEVVKTFPNLSKETYTVRENRIKIEE